MLKFKDEKLMNLVKTDHSSAMTELVRRYQTKLFHFFYRMSGDKLLAEDLVQESFLRLYKYRANYKQDKPLFAWLFQIARNVWNTSFKNQQRNIESEKTVIEQNLNDKITNPSDSYDMQQMITTALLQLTERDRELVILYHLKGFNYKELSALFEISEGTLRVKLCRALKKLGLILKSVGYENN